MNSASQVRQKLLESTLDSVKVCQAKFGGKPELATTADAEIGQLCKQIELILNHGLKDRDSSLGLAVIRNVRDLVGGGELESRKLWRLVKTILPTSEHQRFLLLNNINTDPGRGRAWIRSSLNEQSLEKFCLELLRDKVRLRDLYEDWAFMRDADRSVLLPSMAAGLASIRFALQIDDSSLNGEEKVPQVISNSISSILPIFKQEIPTEGSVVSSNPEIAQETESKHVVVSSRLRTRVNKKKKLKTTSQVVSFDDNLTMRSPDEIAEEAVDNPFSSNYRTDNPFSSSSAVPPPISPFSTQSASGDDSFLFNNLASQTGSKVDVPDNHINGTETHGLTKNSSYSSIFSDKSIVSGDVTIGSNLDKEINEVRANRSNNCDRDNESINSTNSNFNQASNTSLELSFESVSLEAASRSSKARPADGRQQEVDDFDIYNQSTVKSATPDRTTKYQCTPLTPVTNKDVGVLFPVHPEEKTSRLSLDLDTLDPPGLDYAPLSSGSLGYGNSLGNSISKLTVNNSDTISNVSGESGRSSSSLGKEDLRKALLSVMEKKEELENQLKSLRQALNREVQSHKNLHSEFETIKTENQEQNDKLESRNSILARENELLKHQLKKYVGAVQKLRDGPQAYETLARLESQNESKEINSKYVDYHYEASEYEKKLIQVAEMHGELLEFNEMLQKSAQTKDQLIHRLRSELVLLRGPLPEDQDNWETSSMTSSSDLSSITGNPRILVNIWIPSVFLTGAGSSRHHVYQVYIRIQDIEWNVYRRYNQFLDLHQQTKKQDPIVASFQFPPKKAMGNRSERFVESRRKQLQTYLRAIVNYLVSTNEIMANCPDKETLVSLMPFFSDAPPGDGGGGGGRRNSILGGRLSSDSSSSRIVL